MGTVWAAAGLAAAFLLGAVPFGWIWSRVRYGVDIRSQGSANIGATNVARTHGWRAGLGVLALDAAKGALPPALALAWWPGRPAAAALAGLMPLLGHVFSPFLGFKGGKGVAAGVGALAALDWRVAAAAVAVFAVVTGATRLVSLGSGTGVLAAALGLGLLDPPPYLWGFGLPAAVVVLWAHRGNWARIRRGQEPRWGRGGGPAGSRRQ
ncbi:Glycerol-3-phosphate acyltransferase [Candidatus Hydrogenisulfobacillus filiaventi]|uniref:Glycerol-3-phosphate acyltransferase n=1 Tax=Candidatus Hydrogenisulfobacillus filiaventi TaxID=2707344 RepID=A0A6F8ZI54_9FIRM|nr:glycerol-3-phosphate 1-O-acyltransferase PlsY [Bacillota bacterium]CAB1129268.1 Glycerol-3-phosphate acyltransferase [Candidatus Hydrogenisulfobacillus filiaventi]